MLPQPIKPSKSPDVSNSSINPLFEEEIKRYQGNHRISSDFEQASGTLCKSIGHSNVLSRTPRNARLGSCELETLLKSTLFQKLCRGGMKIDAHPYVRSKPEDRIISPDLEKIEGSSRTDLFMDHELTQRSVHKRGRVWRVRCEATSDKCVLFCLFSNVSFDGRDLGPRNHIT